MSFYFLQWQQSFWFWDTWMAALTKALHPLRDHVTVPVFSGDKSKSEERCEMTHTPNFSSLSCCRTCCPVIPSRLWSRKWKHADDPRRSSKRQFSNRVPLYYSEIKRSNKNCRTPLLHLCTAFSAMTHFFSVFLCRSLRGCMRSKPVFTCKHNSHRSHFIIKSTGKISAPPPPDGIGDGDKRLWQQSESKDQSSHGLSTTRELLYRPKHGKWEDGSRCVKLHFRDVIPPPPAISMTF